MTEAEISDGARQKYALVLDSLLDKAFSTSPFEALCTLLRVGGMADANWDPFEESRAAFDDYNWILGKAGSERGQCAARRIGLLMYCQAVEMTAPHEILANLLRCIAKKSYTIDPFSNLGRSKKGKLFSRIPPSAKQKFQRIKSLAEDAAQTGVVAGIDKFFDERVRNAFSHSDYVLTEQYFRFSEGGLAQQISVELLDGLIAECFAFYGAFLYLHKESLSALGQGKRFHQWPNYEVLEILSSGDEGVYGFQVHFSNGSRSKYARRKSGIEAINLRFDKDDGINFMVGSLDDLEPAWKIDGKLVEDWGALP
jgi:hypothetical protein